MAGTQFQFNCKLHVPYINTINYRKQVRSSVNIALDFQSDGTWREKNIS